MPTEQEYYEQLSRLYHQLDQQLYSVSLYTTLIANLFKEPLETRSFEAKRLREKWQSMHNVFQVFFDNLNEAHILFNVIMHEMSRHTSSPLFLPQDKIEYVEQQLNRAFWETYGKPEEVRKERYARYYGKQEKRALIQIENYRHKRK